jgi:hypothetical protein
VSKRVSPAERLRVEIDEVFAGGEDLSRAIERVAQLGARRPRWRRFWAGIALSGQLLVRMRGPGCVTGIARPR